MNLSVIGIKGSGKGTQANRLVNDFNLIYFSPGEMFREGVKKRTPLGILAEKYMSRGELVPDDFVNAMVEEWLWTTNPKKGIIFDGFPRTTYQAAFLEHVFQEMGRTFHAVIYLDVSDEMIAKRLSGRRWCRVCKDEFHLVSAPFTSCPYKKCTGQYRRPHDEDRPEIVATLLSVYQRGIQPLLNFYKETDRVIVIDGNGDAEAVHTTILDAVMRYR